MMHLNNVDMVVLERLLERTVEAITVAEGKLRDKLHAYREDKGRKASFYILRIGRKHMYTARIPLQVMLYPQYETLMNLLGKRPPGEQWPHMHYTLTASDDLFPGWLMSEYEKDPIGTYSHINTDDLVKRIKL